MAGSAPRSSDPRTDDRLRRQLLASAKDRDEHAVLATQVVQRYQDAGARVSRGATHIAAFANIQHLATDVCAEFDEPPSVLELCGVLHPTAAVGGDPWPDAAALIDAHEQLERGWYAGAVGWTDAEGDGEFMVALRCGLLWEDGVRLYAGAGLMPDSDPLAELAETDLKFLALLDSLRAAPAPPQSTRRDAQRRLQPA
jgi:salicylate biosynthesis isochorismate synthase/menaquinone-specific isochorismate synthase